MRRNYVKISLLIVFGLLVVITTTCFYHDSRHEKEMTFEFKSDAPDTSFFFPVSEYLIELNELKQRQVQSTVWLKDLKFPHDEKDQDRVDSLHFESLLLRSYIVDTNLHNPYKVDWVISYLETMRGEYCYKVPPAVENIKPATIMWTPNRESAIFYPFDRYEIKLNLEEQVSYDGAVTNTSPEKIMVHCKVPNFLINKKGDATFILSRPYTFKMMSIVFLLLVTFYIIYLWTKKSRNDILPQCIGLFTGVWSIRSIISTNAPVFPTVIDYFTLLIFMALGTLLFFHTVYSHDDK